MDEFKSNAIMNTFKTQFPLVELTNLNLSGNLLYTILYALLQENRSLYSVDLSSNLIQKFESNAFAGLSNLKALSLSKNNLIELDKSFLKAWIT